MFDVVHWLFPFAREAGQLFREDSWRSMGAIIDMSYDSFECSSEGNWFELFGSHWTREVPPYVIAVAF